MKKLLPVFILTILLAFGCTSEKSEQTVIKQPVTNPYIQSFTSDMLKSFDEVEINLIQEVKNVEIDAECDAVSLQPKVKGSWVWESTTKLAFHPEERYAPGAIYKVTLKIDELYSEVAPENAPFQFTFSSVKRDYKAQVSGLFSDESQEDAYTLKGYVNFSDHEKIEEIQKMLTATHDDKPVQVRWEISSYGGHWNYFIDHLSRQEAETFVQLQFDGSQMGIDKKVTKKVTVPARAAFRLMNIRAIDQDQQYLSLEFSDKLDTKQDFTGMVNVSAIKQIRYAADGNTLKVYFDSRLTGMHEVVVSKGILSASGKSLAEDAMEEIQFEAIKPEIRFIGKGVIIPPTGKGSVVSFEAVSLNAVDLYVIKIFDKNVPQYLQEANLDESDDYEIMRTGRLILTKKIDLVADHVLNYGKWNAFSLDLSELIQPEPGAIYRIELRMRKAYSTYECTSEEEYNGEYDFDYKPEDWDDLHYWPPYADYRWSERDNPCNYSYYNRNFIYRNVLASDLGIIAKKDAANNYRFYVNSLTKALAVSDAEVTIYDYQGIGIKRSKTDAQGKVELKIDRQPYLAIVEKDGQKGYLRLDGRNQLSYSNFDVSGAEVQKGIKGFIYAERGVWRPGDSIFVNFILEDKLNQIPDNHPVEFTLTNPNGQVTKRMISTSGINGFYPFHVNTAAEAPTGSWTAKVTVGDATFTKRLRIETVKPNRLKINLDFGTDTLKAYQPLPEAKVKVAWLHGATANQLKVVTEVSYRNMQTTFPGYPNYVFTDPTKKIQTTPESVFERETDDMGEASFLLKKSNLKDAPGFVQARFFTRAFENGGDFSSSVKSVVYAPYNNYVGVKTPALRDGNYYYDTNKNYIFEIATVDADGNPVDINKIEVSLQKLSWRWWWSAESNDMASYSGRNSYTPYLEKKVNSKNGKATVQIKVGERDWGRYMLHVNLPNGHSTGKAIYFDWPYGNRSDGPGGATQLTFSANKKEFTVGEDIEIKLPGGDGARALISVENGSQMVTDFWVNLNDAQNKVAIKTTPEMAPNVFVNVMLIQPHANTKNDHPIRMYGAIPILVEDLQTILHPVVNMPDVLRPEKEVKLTVSEQNGKAMTYTVAVVDEGLLDLTNFKTPNPHDVFYAREALGVQTWDIYDLVTGAYGGKIEKMFAIGGDAELNKDSKKKANRFIPVVQFFGPYQLKAGETATHKYTMPRYVGSVRTMVVAGNQGAYGQIEKTTPVRNPLMVAATLPRVLGPKEKVLLPITVFAMESQIKSATVKITTEGELKLAGESSKTVQFDRIGEQDIWFEMEAGSAEGIGKVHVVATSGKETARYDIELDIRHPNQKITKAHTVKVDPGQTWESTLELPGMAGTNDLNVEISGIQPINLSGRIDQLIRYPYGCVEQTVSSVFPQLYLHQFYEFSDFKKKEVQRNIETVIKRLQSFQTSDGGFSYWPGGSYISEWGNNYAGHFMLEAEKAGYSLPVGLKKSWLKSQKKLANDFKNSTSNTRSHYYGQFTQAYRLFTLSLANDPMYSAMNRLKNEKELNKQTRWRLALAYAYAGRPETALELIDVRDLAVEEYVEMKYVYGSAFRDRAMLLETLTQSKYDEESSLLLKQLSEVLNSDKWLSTQETAWALIAIAHYYDAYPIKDAKQEYQLTVGKSTTQKSQLKTKVEVFNYTPSGINETITFKNTGEPPLFLTLSANGIPEVGSEEASSKNLGINVRFLDMADRELNVGNLKQGTDFKVLVTVEYNGINAQLDNLALQEIFPSGWEILNSRLFTGEENKDKTVPDYQDIRDDRVYTFFSIKKGKTATFEIRLNAAYAGTYYLPQFTVEAMYSDNYYARNKGRWVEVVK